MADMYRPTQGLCPPTQFGLRLGESSVVLVKVGHDQLGSTDR
jgi:hypothetical protein